MLSKLALERTKNERGKRKKKPNRKDENAFTLSAIQCTCLRMKIPCFCTLSPSNRRISLCWFCNIPSPFPLRSIDKIFAKLNFKLGEIYIDDVFAILSYQRRFNSLHARQKLNQKKKKRKKSYIFFFNDKRWLKLINNDKDYNDFHLLFLYARVTHVRLGIFQFWLSPSDHLTSNGMKRTR